MPPTGVRGPRAIGERQMGEQPVPAKNEVERALASMSAGFHSGSDQIAAGIASLEAHLAQAPLNEQERVRAAIVQIVATHARLKGQVERLPQPSWDRFKAMVSVLKAQQTLLDEVGLLVKEHVLPRQMQNLSSTSQPESPPPAPVSASATRRAPTPVAARARRGRPAPVDDDDEPRSVFSRIRVGPAFRGLLAMAVAGVALSLMPRDIKLVDLGAKIIDMVGGEGAQPAPAHVPEAPTTPPPALAGKRSEERAPTAVAEDKPSPAPVVAA